MKKLLSFTAVYGITHLLVDAICVGTVLSLQVMNQLDNKTSGCLIVLYNLIAFGIQPILGYLCDHYQRSKTFAVLGILLTICSLLLMQSPLIVVIMLGIGNALYHIGGGIISLNTTPNKATAPGLFVAPGAIGVFVATIISGNLTALIAIVISLMVCMLAILLVKFENHGIYDTEEPFIDNKGILIIMALLLVISIRSLVGGAIVFDWQITMTMKLAALAMVVAGKALGGLLADRFGFLKTGVGGLVIAAPLLTWGMDHWVLGLLGLLFFNLTMPITLTVLANTFKKYKGFAFGLTTSALVAGYSINRFFGGYYHQNTAFMVGGVLASAGLLYFGLEKWTGQRKTIRKERYD